MEKHVHPALLLAVIGSVILFGANTVVSDTIWRPAGAARPLAAVDNGTGPTWVRLETGRTVLLRTADGRTSQRPAPPAGDAACEALPLGPRANLTDVVCSLDP